MIKKQGIIIGFGNVVEFGHWPAFLNHPELEIVGVLESDSNRQEHIRKISSNLHIFHSIKEVMEQPNIDFWDIATPPAYHYEYLKKGIESNIFLLCEKPLVLNMTDFDSISHEMDKPLIYSIHNWKYSPVIQKVNHLVHSGIIGNLMNIRYEVVRTQPSVTAKNSNNWRLDPLTSGGGVLADHGWHAFYLTLPLLQQNLSEIECSFEKRKYHDLLVEDTCSLRIQMDQGGVVDYFFTWAGQERKNNIWIQGDLGSISVLDNELLLESEYKSFVINFDEGLSQGSFHANWFESLMNDFYHAIQDPYQMLSNWREAKLCQTVLHHAQVASSKGKQILKENLCG